MDKQEIQARIQFKQSRLQKLKSNQKDSLSSGDSIEKLENDIKNLQSQLKESHTPTFRDLLLDEDKFNPSFIAKKKENILKRIKEAEAKIKNLEGYKGHPEHIDDSTVDRQIKAIQNQIDTWKKKL
jgi:chromosome segregation ATPase